MERMQYQAPGRSIMWNGTHYVAAVRRVALKGYMYYETENFRFFATALSWIEMQG